MQGDTSLLIDATRKASRFLHRDYLELENLQLSGKGSAAFCNKSCSRAVESLQLALSKYYKTIIFSNEEAKNIKFSGKAALVEPLDGIDNLERAIPFFGIVVTILSKKNDEIITEKCVLNFPALNEIYYAEKGKGAWVERHSSNSPGSTRIRVSGVNHFENTTIAANYKQLATATKISSNIRSFSSYSYSAALIASGKIDACIFLARDISAPGIELLITEAGGRSFIDKGVFFGSNYQLYDKIKQLPQES